MYNEINLCVMDKSWQDETDRQTDTVDHLGGTGQYHNTCVATKVI